MNDTLAKLTEIARKDLVDLVGGTQPIGGWARDICSTYYRKLIHPENIVLILKKVGENYQGELYINPKDFEMINNNYERK